MTMSKGPCVADLAAQLAEVGITGVSELTLGNMINTSLGEAHIRGITDPKAKDEFVSSRVFDELMGDKEVSRDAAVKAARVSDAAVSHISKNHTDDMAGGVHSLLTGTLRDRDSVATAQQVATNQALGEFHVAMEEAGVLEAFVHADKQFVKDVFSQKTDGLSRDVLAVRSVLEQYEAKRWARIKQEGVGGKALPNRMTRQHHDPHLLMNAKHLLREEYPEANSSQEAWTMYMYDTLDMDRTFSGAKEHPDDILAEMYNNFTMGRGNVVDGAVNPERAVADPLVAERALHFKPEGEVDYMFKFGAGSLAETVFTEINRYGKHLGMLQKLGGKPYQTLVDIINRLRLLNPEDKRLDGFTKGFGSGQLNNKVGRLFTEVAGHNDMVVGTKLHEVSSWLQTAEFVTKLGSSMPAAIADVGGMAAELNYQQGNPIAALAQSIGAVIQGIASPPAQRRVAESIAVGMESMLNDHSMRLGSSISPSGLRTNILNTTFRWNLLGPWTNSVRRGLFMANSKYMAALVDDPTLIHSRYEALLGAYGVTKDDMLFLNKHLDMEVGDGSRMLDVTRIELIDLKAFGGGELGFKKRMDLQRKLTGFFLDRNDFGVYTPDANVRAMVHRGLPKGDPMRVVHDLFFQFKQYPIGMVGGPLKNSLMGPGQTRMGGVMGLTSHMAFLIPFGAAIVHLKDFFKNKEQFVPENKEEYMRYFGAAMLQSGAMGLYADLLMGQVKTPGDLVFRLGGPTLNDAIDYGSVAKEFVTGGDDKGGKMWKAVRNDIPMADIFYLKTPLDFGIMYGIAEQLDPGWTRRYEASVKSQRMGRGLKFSPSEYALGV